MPTDFREKAFETAIEEHLLTHGGYAKANPDDFDRALALDQTQLFAFIEATQPKEWAYLVNLHGANAKKVFLDDLCKWMDSQGLLTALRHGFKCYGKEFRVAYFAPAHSMNPETQARYQANRLTVARQVHFSPHNEKSIDLLICLNGLPVVTAELKNPMTGQTVENAKLQYMNDRDPNELIFQFKKRSLVHFVVDPDEAWMTTRLSGNSTYFLPFNKGRNNGAGNPDNPDGHKTAYLWEYVWSRDSLLDILGRFMHLQIEEKEIGGKKIKKETMIFPRYHQLDSVRKLEASARVEGPGNNYLIQHSAGSGKSNSIAWVAYRLASLYDDHDKRVFDSVIVITDRLVLDKQLQDTIFQFEHKSGVVEKIDEDSTQLAGALMKGTPIIITTLQKFPFVTEKVGALPERRYAVIVDEAHSSQSGEGAAELKGVLAANAIKKKAKEEAEAQGLVDHEEEILKTMARRGHQPNISFFAFTATPKYKTLEVFGRPGADGKPAPFHLYSMRQAIDENFILDVLRNYTTYKTYYRLIKTIADDPKVEKRKAARALARFMKLHPVNVAQKTEVMVEHFRAVTRHKIGGRAKAMVVTDSRLAAVRYKQAFDKYILEKGYTDIKTLVAFSGTVIDPDIADHEGYTEVGMNKGIKEKELPDKFGSDEYQILLVAEKYQTGFDQPLLHTMYVDKRLADIQAVQTLSRLNRTCTGKKDTFILDFVNDVDEIQAAFQPYYEQPEIGERSDPQQLYELKAKMEGMHVFDTGEVEGFAKVFFKPRRTQTPSDHAALNAALDPAVSRFKTLTEDEQEGFRTLAVAYRNLYAFLSQVMPYQDADLEKLYTFLRFLLSKIPRRSDGPPYHPDDEVALKYYRLQKISEGTIILEAGKGGTVSGTTEVGTGAIDKEKIELSQLIDRLNQRFSTDFKPADQLFFDSVREDAKSDTAMQQAAKVNTLDNFGFVFDKVLLNLMIQRMENNEGIVAKFMNDPDFGQAVTDTLRREVYDQIRGSTETR